MPRLIHCIVSLLFLTVFVALSHAQAATQKNASAYKPDPGPYKVATVDLELTRDNGRPLPIKIRWPQGRKDKAAVVVFSHGAGGSGEGFADLSTHWASWGYLVILPTHSDSIAMRKKAGEDLSRLRQEPRSLLLDVKPTERVQDVSLIFDTLNTIEEKTGITTDRSRLAVAGHSAGGLTSEIAAGVKVRRWGAGLMDEGDKRIKAAIVISGPGTYYRQFTKDSWKDLVTPMIVITGSLDKAAITDETPEGRREPYELAKPGDKYLLWIEGATHGSFGGKTISALLRERPTTDVKIIQNLVAASTTAFLDAYLLQNPDAQRYLQSHQLETYGGGKAQWNKK